MKLRYVGAGPTTFVEAGELEPGAEFTVPDDQADGWLRRDDIEEAPPEPVAETASPAKPSRKASKTTETDAAPAAPEE